MKNIVILLSVMFSISSLAFSYGNYSYGNYPYDNYYYGDYSYDGSSQYPSYSYGYKPSSRPVVKTPVKPIARVAPGSLEQQHKNLVVMFTMKPCPYCDYLKPIINQAEMKFGKNIKFLYVDIKQFPQYPNQYGFSTVPQIYYFKNGKKIHVHDSGNKTMTIDQVVNKIKTYFP